MTRTAKIIAMLGLLVLCGSVWAVEPNLVSHWKFDEGSGTIAYDSIGSNDGTLVNGPVWTTGQIGGGLSFSGDDDYVDCGDKDSLDFGSMDSFSITAWVKTSSSIFSPIVSKIVWYDCPIYGCYREGYTLGIHQNKLYFGIRDVQDNALGNYGNTILNDDEWHYVAAVRDTVTDKTYIYVDGYLDATPVTDITTQTLANSVKFEIGKRRAASPIADYYYFDGSIDDVRIYDKALSAEEIQQLYQNGVGELIGLEITGPEEVAENFQMQYAAIAYYDNNSTRDVTDSAQWFVEPNAIASINSNGLLTTEEIYLPEEDITIYAQYTEDTNTFEAEKEVSVLAICPSGSALSFDGVDDYVVVQDAPILSPQKITLMAWIYPEDVSHHFQIIGKWGHHGEAADYIFDNKVNNDALRLAGGSSEDFCATFSNDAILTAGTWQHVAVTYDGSTSIFYVNGVKAGEDNSCSVELPDTENDVYIGYSYLNSPSGGHRPFNGTIDEIAIWNRALSAEEIQANMHTRLSGDEPNLVGYWGFDEGEGQVAYDLSGNGNDGQLGSTPNPDNSDPAWVESDAPIGICTPVEVDIKPGSCPNPLNVASKGVLPVAILGSDTFDVTTIDAASIFLDGVPAIRSSLEDVAAPASDGNECDCNSPGPDGYSDLTLKFRTHQVVEKLIDWPGELAQGETLLLTLTGELSDGTAIEGTDCVVLVGNVPRWLSAKKWDGNEDGVVNLFDLAEMAQYWLESSVVTD